MSLSNEWPQRGETLGVLDIVLALCHSEVTPLVVSDGRNSAGAWDVVPWDPGAGSGTAVLRAPSGRAGAAC